MTIGELAARAGLAPSAIRFYEKAGLLQSPPRANGRRVYGEDAAHQLVIICFAKATGFSLTEIKLLLYGFPAKTTASARWKKMARGKLSELETILTKAQAMKRVLESMMSCRDNALKGSLEVKRIGAVEGFASPSRFPNQLVLLGEFWCFTAPRSPSEAYRAAIAESTLTSFQ
jgi:MerR family redox-sensitive transcriptional activator SoxR